MIIGHINKLDKKSINKNFIKRHGLEKIRLIFIIYILTKTQCL